MCRTITLWAITLAALTLFTAAGQADVVIRGPFGGLIVVGSPTEVQVVAPAAWWSSQPLSFLAPWWWRPHQCRRLNSFPPSRRRSLSGRFGPNPAPTRSSFCIRGQTSR